ncbi:MAG: hydantoinase/oxoprolinase family protein, partial [Proteobacteria bacterium]|nr:hydantoinase/oxoprolinase family protein [Pseudomonadota bacterium]
MAMFVGTDIGGTFTDVVGYDSAAGKLTFGKKLTNRSDLVEGVLSCLDQVSLPLAAITTLKHGTTQVINTLVERTGARTALVTTEGFRDIVEIGRAGRPIAFDLNYTREAPLVEREMCIELAERIDAHGEIITPISEADLERLVARLAALNVEAIAVSFLNAYLNPVHEQTVVTVLRDRLPQAFVTAASELSREWFEYERTSTAVANAYVGPKTRGYVTRFDEKLSAAAFPGLFYMMGSNGGVLSIKRTIEQPIALVESGPIGGCVGASFYAKHLGVESLIAFDMGGTTAKCALVEGGLSEVQDTYYVGGYDRGFPLRSPVLDIVEVGTGGGSIAYVDGARLHVGPLSAGSDPGPVCFGQGGSKPTVTDINLLLGRISGERFLNGRLPLDAAAAHKAVVEEICRPLGYTDRDVDHVGDGILTLANAQMATAIKEITIERGRDVRDFALFVFGGGGPLHGIDLARELGIPQVIVPPEPGNFSALGMLFADARVDEAQSFRLNIDEVSSTALQEQIRGLTSRVEKTLREEFSAESVVFEYQAEMRFRGQRHSLRVGFAPQEDMTVLRKSFFAEYLRKYGHVD